MAEALAEYYHRRDPLGAPGDFTTAPEISQMFGELIGLWCAVVWQSMGAPDPVRLVELGPGRGTLMADLLRAAGMVPAFRAAIRVHLVETSPALRARQAKAVPGATWHDSLAEVPDGPTLLVANEFFDALPIRQWVWIGGAWRERLVAGDETALTFTLGPPTQPPLVPGRPADGDMIEDRPEGRAVASLIGARLARSGGAALIVDYGHARHAFGDTLQAVRRHRFHPVLEDPGEVDLTAHVDFEALAEAARAEGATTHGPIGQGEWLKALGIDTRAEMLSRDAGAKALDIAAALRRLTHPTEMGTLFKVLAITHPGLAPPPASGGA
ncbi:MAG: SAM-dependent methyltransferase [Alphaproteobacteria bacterium]|nr:SAM-dependent methyltransferase [Alphaproteobacteria bacterium]